MREGIYETPALFTISPLSIPLSDEGTHLTGYPATALEDFPYTNSNRKPTRNGAMISRS